MGCLCPKKKGKEYHKPEETSGYDYGNSIQIKNIKKNEIGSNDDQIEVSNANETNFINDCNNFLKKIKINKKNLKIEFLNREYILYEDSNLTIQVLGKIEAGLNDIDYLDYVSILFENSKAVGDDNLKEGISEVSNKFKEKGVELKSDYSLFIEEVGGFIVDGKLLMKYENEENKFIYEFILKIKTDEKEYETSVELIGILRLEIIFKKKPYLIHFKNKNEAILFSTIINILIFVYEDKIPLIIGLLEIISKEDKKAKNIDFNELLKNLPKSDMAFIN